MPKILIQAGHVSPREPGFETGTGTAHEQDLALALRTALLALFAKDRRFEAIGVPGDIPNGIKVDAAIFLHGDGSSNGSVSGYCFGYPDARANQRLATLIGNEFDKIPGHPPHRRDNYTRNLSGYYGFSRVETLGPEVVVEHGFLTNVGERLWLFANADAIARAEYIAVCRYFGLNPLGSETSAQNRKRLATLRRWILTRRRQGRSWAWLKRTANFREYRRRGGK